MNTRKLNLITEATTAFPGVSINDAILLFLRNRYSSDQGLSDLIARYLSTISAYNFDGVDDYGVLANRAINPDGDNSFEFFTPASLASFRAIITQSDTGTLSSREFTIYTGPTGLLVRFGGVGTYVMTIEQGLKTSTRYGLTLNGTTAQVFEGGLSGALVSTASFTRGAAREPAAKTNICCMTVNGGADNFFAGLQYDIKINGTLWRMADRNQAIQLPEPSGLGAELITPAVLENPTLAENQWTYLGGGRWQYIGDGTANALQFFGASANPDSGFMEFEIESISGGSITCTSGILAGSIFNTVGVKSYFYTAKSGTTTFQFKRANVGVAVSCIIKNISFKPLGTCNPMTLVNVTSDRWQEVPQ